jgi:ankyrin repeat protein
MMLFQRITNMTNTQNHFIQHSTFYILLVQNTGDIATVEDLLSAGDDVNARGAQQRTPLHRAVGKGHNAVVTLLVAKGASPDLVDQGGLTALHWAALFGLVDTGKILMSASSDINAQTKTGETPLHLAAEKGKLEMVKYLLELGARTDIRDKGAGGGATAFDAAKRSGQKEIAELLKPPGSSDGCCTIS